MSRPRSSRRRTAIAVAPPIADDRHPATVNRELESIAARDVAEPPAAKDLLTARGTGGLVHYAGVINEEPLDDLRGKRGIETYRKMTWDSVVGAALLTLKLLMRQVQWTVAPASDEPADLEAGEFLRQCRDDLDEHTWPDFLDEAFSMLDYGWSAHEIMWKRRLGESDDPTRNSRFNDGRFGWAGFPGRPQDTLDRWSFHTETGKLTAMVQRDPVTYKELVVPVEKLLLFRPSAPKNNPEGRTPLRAVYDSWHYKTNARRYEGIGMERDLAGLPRIRIPSEYLDPNAPAEQQQVRRDYEHMGTQVRRNRQACVLLPSDRDQSGNYEFDFDLVSSGGQRQFDTDKVIARYNKEMAMALLADVLLIGHESVGSYSLASTKTNLLAVSLGAYLDAVRDVLNRVAVPKLFRVNAGAFRIERLPTFHHGDVEAPDLKELGEWIKALTLAGVDLTDDQTQEHLRRVSGLPVPVPEGS